MFKRILLINIVGLLALTQSELIDWTKYESDPAIDNDVNKSLKEIVQENGYAYEEYTVVTKDSFVLTLHRIPGRFGESGAGKPVVYFQHGMDSDAFQWVINSADRAPAFDTVNAGYDVWMGNNRGSQFSMRHLTMDPANREFWQWSFEEMGLYDVPALLDVVLQKTGQEKVSYIAHSMGTTQTFIGLSMINDYYKDRLNLFVALAPPTRISNTECVPLKIVAENIGPLSIFIEKIGMYNMFGPDYLINNAVAIFCDKFLDLCVNLLKMLTDADPSVDNLEREKTYFTHLPSGSGYKNQLHFGQIIASAHFARYDHGTSENLQKYGQSTPPDYDLASIKGVPIALFGGETDLLVSVTDVDWLSTQLGEKPVWYKQYPLGHMSFAIAKDMSWFKVDVLNLVNQYATNSYGKSFLSL